MPDPQLLEYVKQCRDQHIPDETIRQTLLDADWSEQDVDLAFENTTKTQTQVTARPRRKHRILKVTFATLGIIGGLVALLFFTPNILGLFLRDIPPANDSDLAMKTLNIPAEQNAFLDAEALRQLANGSFTDLSDYNTGKRWDNDDVAAILSRNQTALEKFKTTLNKPYWQDPNYATPNIDLNTVDPLAIWRTMSSLANVQALYLARQNKQDEAVAELIATAQLGHRILISQASLSEYLVGLSIQKRAMESLQQIAGSSINPAVTTSAQETLRMLNTDMSNMIKTQYRYQTLLGEDIVTIEIPLFAKDAIRYRYFQNGYSFQLNKTNKRHSELYRSMMRVATSPCEYVSPSPVLTKNDPPYLYYIPNGLGDEIVDSHLPAMETTMRKTCETQQLTNATIEALTK